MTTSLSRRGLKRTCQDDDCGVRFYDLNKSTIACPVCGAGFTAPRPQPPREVTIKSASTRRPFSHAFSSSGRAAAASPPLEARIDDGEEIADEVIDEVVDEVADISLEVDDSIGDKTESILELDDEVEDIAPDVPTDKDNE